MSRIAYVNGRYLPQRQASVNVEDRGYQFGDGVYEVFYLRGSRFMDAALHLDRLERSLAEIRIAMPMPRVALHAVCAELARRNRVAEGLVYLQVTRGVARREHVFPTAATPPALVVTVRRLPPFPRDLEAWAAAAITRPDERWRRCDIKSVNLLANVLAKQAAREAGAVEAKPAHPARLHPRGAVRGACPSRRRAGVQRRRTRVGARGVPDQRDQLRAADYSARWPRGRRRRGRPGDAPPVRTAGATLRRRCCNAAFPCMSAGRC